MNDRIIIVEGKTDKERLLAILAEEVEILCTYGTLSDEKIEQWIHPLQDQEVFVLVDADAPGNKLRKRLKQELPNAKHLYTRRMYREVARTPMEVLAEVLDRAHFAVRPEWLIEQEQGRRRT
jgi:toprim domain protein